jgi:hypothetical protein
MRLGSSSTRKYGALRTRLADACQLRAKIAHAAQSVALDFSDRREAATIAHVTTTVDTSSVVQALQRPAATVPDVLESPQLLPAAPGFYGWWSWRGALASVPYIPHPLHDDVCLLYVGISPARETSRQTVRSRVIGNHLNGNVGSSTFRFVLAAFLIDALELHPYLRGMKVALSAPENARLSAWQREHLFLTWCVRQRPWEIESEAIAQLGPPLNSAANAVHAFYPTARAARAEFRRRARAASSVSAEARTIR